MSSDRGDYIEKMRHELRQAERQDIEMNAIIQNLINECQLKDEILYGQIKDEDEFKEKIRNYWMSGYCLEMEYVMNNWEYDEWSDVVGDVMDEIHQRLNEDHNYPSMHDSQISGTSEIDVNSMFEIMDEDVKNLRELCAELFIKFVRHPMN